MEKERQVGTEQGGAELDVACCLSYRELLSYKGIFTERPSLSLKIPLQNKEATSKQPILLLLID